MKSFLKKSIVKFTYALQGVKHGLLHDKSIRIQAVIGGFVVLVCLLLSLSFYEWIMILSMILLVLGAEFMNSAMEELCDRLYPEYDIRAKKIKDYSAAAVLFISGIAALVGIAVIGGKLF